jgi:hypothetical protein
MLNLNDREKYCMALLILNGGKAHYQHIRDIILESKESFELLSERYLKYSAIKRNLNSLVNKGLLSEKELFYTVNPVFKIGFINEYPVIISKAIKAGLEFRDKHVLEFNTIEIEDLLLDENSYDEPPYDLIDHLKSALDLHRIGSFDSVLMKCGKTVEIITSQMNKDYELFACRLSTGNMINQLKNEDIISKIEADREDVKTFANGLGVVYRFRNIMGAHSNEEEEWGLDQIATSCLILTLYLTDFYMTKIRKY